MKRAAMYIKLNDLVVATITSSRSPRGPEPRRSKAGLSAHLSGWDNDLWQLASWYRET